VLLTDSSPTPGRTLRPSPHVFDQGNWSIFLPLAQRPERVQNQLVFAPMRPVGASFFNAGDCGRRVRSLRTKALRNSTESGCSYRFRNDAEYENECGGPGASEKPDRSAPVLGRSNV